MAKRRLARTAVLTAATLLAPLGSVPVAGATDPAAGPTAFTGTVYLPDGETVAKAAAVDLSLAGVKPFARGVSGLDGRFSVDVPETDELVALALAAGSSLSVRWTASDLYPQASVPPPTVSTQAVLGAVHTSPGFGQVAGEVVAHLIDTTTNTLANALSDPKMVEFHLPDVAGTGPLVTKVTDLAAAAGIFNDPDMIEGNEDLDDPDLVPPLGSLLDIETVTDAAAHDPASLGWAQPPTATQQSGCAAAVETWLLPIRGTKPPEGTAYDAALQLLVCKDDEDSQKDYYAWAWDGKVTNADTGNLAYRIWRYKFRTHLTSGQGYDFSKYQVKATDPDEDRPANNNGEQQIHWKVGWSQGIMGQLEGDYTIQKAKKIHQWDDGAYRSLYHVSWISNTGNGSRGANFHDGGGMTFLVPQGEPRHRIRTARNTIYIWRCWWPHRDDGQMSGGCDPQD